MDQSNSSSTPSNRSIFVTVVAWIFIAITGFTTFISLLQALMFVFVFHTDQIPPPSTQPGFQEMPLIFRFMMEHIQLFFALFWTLSAVTLVSAIGLLRRRNWGRLAFIGVMAIGIIWNLSGIWVQGQMSSVFPKFHPDAQKDMSPGFETMMTIMTIAMDIFAVVVSLLFAWIIKRLMSKSVRSEFNAL